MSDGDKYIIKRNKIYWYQRKIPTKLQAILEKQFHRQSLKTQDISLAQKRRDIIASADDDYWHGLMNGCDPVSANKAYDKILARAQALNIYYHSADRIADDFSDKDLLHRIEILGQGDLVNSPIVFSAVTGSTDKPRHRISEVLTIYIDKIKAVELKENYNEQQLRHWKSSRNRAVQTFIEICGDIGVDEIERHHARRIYEHFRERILSKDKAIKISAGAANRQIGDLHVLLNEYAKFYLNDDYLNPFRGLRFKDLKRISRPPLPSDWIKEFVSTPALTAGLNLDARVIIWAMIETGMRHIEICNILPENIKIDADIPHVVIEPREGYRLKTYGSERVVPLVGVSLRAFGHIKQNGNRYTGKSDYFSATANKFLRYNKLFPTDAHKLYSLRHSFKDRLIEHGVNEEVIDLLMGHTKKSYKYGDGGSLEYKAKFLNAIKYEFDVEIFNG
uniref:Uncharacterized protein n=1 Tax=OCS116 cluster bacterium TaxID=2030921 RepID=A0A2A4YVN2_9PROT